jgi:hypothetical protein
MHQRVGAKPWVVKLGLSATKNQKIDCTKRRVQQGWVQKVLVKINVKYGPNNNVHTLFVGAG